MTPADRCAAPRCTAPHAGHWYGGWAYCDAHHWEMCADLAEAERARLAGLLMQVHRGLRLIGVILVLQDIGLALRAEWYALGSMICVLVLLAAALGRSRP